MKISDFILANLPYEDPFLFVNSIDYVTDTVIEGNYTFKKDEYFYKGHFKDNPVTPGVILLETMAQIGLVSHAIFLEQTMVAAGFKLIAFSSAEIQFLKPVFPNEEVKVKSKLIYYRLGKIKSEVVLYNAHNELACKGTLAGMVKK